MYREAAREAQETRDAELEGVVALNLSSLYTALWDPEAGNAELERAQRLLPAQSEHWSRLWAQRTYLAVRQGDGESARKWGLQAVEAADRKGDLGLVAQVWDKLGESALREGRLAEAEEYLTGAFRLRKLSRLNLVESSYRGLARLRMAQGRVDEARVLTDQARRVRAVEKPSGAGWWRDYDAAVVYEAAGLRAEALAAARSAVAGAAEWRRQVPPARWMQMAADVTEAEAAGLLATLLAGDGNLREAEEAFLAVEASRATALRAAAWQSQWRQRRKADGSTGPAPVHRFIKERGEPSLALLRGKLGDGEAYFSFLTGERVSLGWMLTKEHFAWGRMPGRSVLESKIEHLRASLSADDPQALPHLQRWVAEWLGWAGPAANRARHWVVSADGPWFAMPWAAVETGRSVSMAPVLSFRESRPAGWTEGGLAAFGDPIYNRADPRFEGRFGPNSMMEQEMPRLAGSADEVRRVTEIVRQARWRAMATTGGKVSVEGLRDSLGRGPAVVHVAAHFFAGQPPPARVAGLPGSFWGRSSTRPREMFLALSLRRDGRLGLLSASEVAKDMEVRDTIVVLSGCASGAGDTLPGAGVQGFAQAWLAAGARAVVGTLWPVADDTGEYFEHFYAALTAGAPASEALATARRAQLLAGGWRARPSAWAGYFSMGKE